MTVTDETVRGSAFAVELRAAAPLMRALKNGLVCAGRDDTLPVLRAVQLHYEGETLEVRSTDRYLALFEQVGVNTAEDAPKSEPWRLLLPYAACQQALTFLKSVPKVQPVTVEWEPRNPPTDWPEYEQGVLRLRSYDGAVELTTLEGDGPRLRGLIPPVESRTAVDEIGFSRANLQAVSKIESDSRNTYLRFGLHNRGSLTRIDWADERRTLLVMGVRVRDDREWGAPGL